MITKINGHAITAPYDSVDPVHKIAHNGVDIAMNFGDPVHAITNGIVSRISDEGTVSFGKSIRIKMENGDEMVYGHLSDFKVKIGQVIHQGDTIGLAGNTGHSTGPHLHIGMYHNGLVMDPTPYLEIADGGTTGMPSVDEWSDHFKQNAEDFLGNAFGIPKGAFHASDDDLTRQVADHIAHNLTDAIVEGLKQLGIGFLHMAPEILLTGCMISIIGMMIGSQRCRHYASLMGIGMIIAKVVAQVV